MEKIEKQLSKFYPKTRFFGREGFSKLALRFSVSNR